MTYNTHQIITRWHRSARVFQGRQRKSTEKWEIWLPLPQKPRNRSSPKFAWVITLCKILSPYDYPLCPVAPQICENVHQVTPLVFFGSSDSLQPRPLHRFSRSICQMTRLRARMCLLGVPKTKFYISTPFSPKNANFWPIFDGTFKISRQKGLNNGDARL